MPDDGTVNGWIWTKLTTELSGGECRDDSTPMRGKTVHDDHHDDDDDDDVRRRQ